MPDAEQGGAARAALPDFVLIGAPRCGTTSLHYYLGLHPQICVSREKELNFFIAERNWDRGVEWYRSRFRAGEGVKARGECSPNYTTFPFRRGVPGRMHSVIPEAKLIYVMRDPFERMMSHHANAVDLGKAPADINEAVRDFETSRFVLASRQAFQLEQFLAYYPTERILLLEHKDLRDRREDTLSRVFAFLGVDAAFRDDRFTRELNASATKRETGAAMTKMLGRRPGRLLPPWIGLPLRRLLLRPFSKPIGRRQLEPELRAKLCELFAEDQEKLRRLSPVS